jgi:hypothetical protein
LADIYGVPTSRLNEQVKRNIERFPDDFMFKLSKEEWEKLSDLKQIKFKLEYDDIIYSTKPPVLGFFDLIYILLPLLKKTLYINNGKRIIGINEISENIIRCPKTKFKNNWGLINKSNVPTIRDKAQTKYNTLI